MKCIKCEKEIQQEFNVCPYCGTKVIEDGVLCKFCGEANKNDSVYCVKCGKRVDGKLICNNCKTIVESEYLYCPTCATPIAHEKVKVTKSARSACNETRGKLNCPTFYKHIVLTALSLLIFIFSCLNIFTLKLDVSTIFEADYKQIEVNYSAFDSLSGALCDENYSWKDFELEYQDEIEDLKFKYKDIEDFEDSLYVIEDVVGETNPFKFMIAAINEEYGESPAGSQLFLKQAIGNSVIGLTFVLVSLSLFILSTYKLGLFITKNKNFNYRFPIFEVSIIALMLISKKFSFDVIYKFENSGWFIACFILTIIYALTNLTFDLIGKFKNRELGKLNLFAIPKMIVCVVALVLCFSTTISLVGSGEDRNQKVSYTNKDFISYFSTIDFDKVNSDKISAYEYNGEIADLIDEDLSSSVVKIYLNPVSAINNIKNVTSYVDALFILSIVAEALLVVALVFYGGSLFNTGKSKIRYTCILSAFSLSLAVMLTNIFAKINLIDYYKKLNITSISKVNLGSGAIVGFAFVTVCLILEIINSEISKHKEKELN